MLKRFPSDTINGTKNALFFQSYLRELGLPPKTDLETNFLNVKN